MPNPGKVKPSSYYSSVLIVTMGVIACVAMLVLAYLQYQTYYSSQEHRLLENVKQQASLIDAVGRFDAVYSADDFAEGAFHATLSQIIDSQQNYKSDMESFSLLVARQQGEEIEYLVKKQADSLDVSRGREAVDRDEHSSILRALADESDVVLRTLHGEQYLEAFAPAPSLGVVIVARILLSEIQQPFINAFLTSVLVLVLLVLLGAVWFVHTINPLSSGLEENLVLNKLIVDTAQDAIITIDENGFIYQANERCKTLFGFDSEELLGHKLDKIMPERFVAMHDQFIAKHSDRPKKSAMLPARELVARHKNGQEFPVSLSLSYGSFHGKLFYTGIIRDISESKRIEAQLREAKELAEHASQAKSVFISNVSHELRTPLNAILGFSELMLAEQTIPTDLREQTEEIFAAGNYLLDLINDILDLSQIESGKLALQQNEFSVNNLLEEVAKLVYVLAKRKGVTIEIAPCPEDVVVHGDRHRIKQILVNLLSNAVKYNKPGGYARLKVQTSLDHGLQLVVEDNGSGIAAANQDKLFERFTRFHYLDSNEQGTGIGLSICKLLADKMGAELAFNSELHQGSRFWLALPASFISSGQTRELGLPQQAVSAERRANLSCLYVEDNEQNAKLLQRILENVYQLHFTHVRTACEAVSKARSMQPDLIFMDLNLPGMDGFDAAVKLREDPATAEIPIVALTAMTTDSHRDRASRLGFSGYLTKPLNRKELDELIAGKTV